MPLKPLTCTACRLTRPSVLLPVLSAVLLTQTGCINVMAIAGKVLFGDPAVVSGFQQRTGVNLAEGHTIGVVCTAPASLSDDFDSLHLDVQEEVIRRMRVRGLDVVNSNDLISAMDATGGRFNEQLIAQAVPGVDYLFHVDLAQFTSHEERSPGLYRGRARGTVSGFQVRRNDETGAADAIPVFQQDFAVEHPSTHPISTDQISQSAFVSQCVDEIANVVGRTFYDVPATDLY